MVFERDGVGTTLPDVGEELLGIACLLLQKCVDVINAVQAIHQAFVQTFRLGLRTSNAARMASVSKTKFIVLYCGCCPWDRCPNLGPAYKQLHDAGFSNVNVLYLANNLGTN